MSGPGRPTKESAERRRRRVAALALGLVLAKDEAVVALAKRIGVGKAAIGKDLSATVEELEAGPTPQQAARSASAVAAADALVEKIRSAGTTLENVDRLIDQLLEAMARGDVDPPLGRGLIDALREKRQVMSAIREDQARLDSRRPVTVVVQFRGDGWRKKVAVNQAAAVAEATLPSSNSLLPSGEIDLA